MKLLSPNAEQRQVKFTKPVVASGKLDFIFSAARDLATAKAYHEDGDENMYTEEMLMKRNKLKADPDVQKCIY